MASSSSYQTLTNNDRELIPSSNAHFEIKIHLQPLCEFTTLVFKREIRFLRRLIFTTSRAIIPAYYHVCPNYIALA